MSLELYVQEALARGRPTWPCSCKDCRCDLHAYGRGYMCVWCQHGQHEGALPG